MKLYKLMAIVASLALAVFAWGCELEDAANDGTTGSSDTAGGTDTGTVTPGACDNIGAQLTAADLDLAGNDNCNLDLFWDADCAAVADADMTIRCGKSKCDFTNGVCESMQPCGVVKCDVEGDIGYGVAKACPNDADCVGTATAPAFACEADGHCDTWCPNYSTGASIDEDCVGNSDSGAYCAGGTKADQCN